MVNHLFTKIWFLKRLLHSLLPNKIYKKLPIFITSSKMTESGENRFGEHGLLGVKIQV